MTTQLPIGTKVEVKTAKCGTVGTVKNHDLGDYGASVSVEVELPNGETTYVSLSNVKETTDENYRDIAELCYGIC